MRYKLAKDEFPWDIGVAYKYIDLSQLSRISSYIPLIQFKSLKEFKCSFIGNLVMT